MAYTATPGQQQTQRGLVETSIALAQGVGDGRPFLAGGVPGGSADLSGVRFRPLAGSAAMGVGRDQDLPNGQRGWFEGAPSAAALGEQFGQRMPAGKPAISDAHGLIDSQPRLVACPVYLSRESLGPLARALVDRVGPLEDLLEGQSRQGALVPLPVVSRQQLGERPATRQASSAMRQRLRQRGPVLIRRFVDGSGGASRPLARTLVMRISPGENLLDGQPRLAGDVADFAIAGQQAGHRQTAGKPAACVPERAVNCYPVFVRCFAHGSGALHRPFARAFAVAVGPGQNLLDC